MTKQEKIDTFDPNGVGLTNGNFIGLPFNEEDAKVILLPVPWDVTVSYNDGTATAAENILNASYQLDLYDADLKDAWKMGIYMRPVDQVWKRRSELLRAKATTYIEWLEAGSSPEQKNEMQENLAQINQACFDLKTWLSNETRNLVERGKLVGIVGGDHSTPLGYLETLASYYPIFGILQIDAHMDLREAYEGFTYSHASIFYNALKIPAVQSLVQTGIRDCCEAEVAVAMKEKERVTVFYDADIRAALYQGKNFDNICDEMISKLPNHVYISFDIDGLAPTFCPNTGTPVPGGLDYQEVMYLLKKVVDSGRKIIGFDLCEVAGVGHEWEGNVAARILYKMANLAGKSL